MRLAENTVFIYYEVVNELDARLLLREKPEGHVVMHQRWEELLFLHWKFSAKVVQASLPPGLFLDTFKGDAWVGVVPFAMRGVRPAGLPAVPGISNFLELNIRTYVHDGKGNFGVWFYSLEANQAVAVWCARKIFHLNYIFAKMRMEKAEKAIRYWSQREKEEEQYFEYRPVDAARLAEPGSLEFFLIERYLLFSSHPKTGAIQKGRVHHAPYRISFAEAPRWSAWGIEAAGLAKPESGADSVLYSRKVEVEVFGLRG